jgi:dTDP-4-amino-4,6-dideoxygalactose transaminase
MDGCMQRHHFSGDGVHCKVCEELLTQYVGCSRTLLTTSCTHALEICGLLLGIQAGDEVILPSFTFVSTANAFVLRGATPVFVDIRPDTLNIDENLIETAITKRTKAIVVVHYGGVGCELDTILRIAEKYGIPVVEDNAHGLFGRYKGRPLGSFGSLSTLSFHETKNISCGEGGALCLNDSQFLCRAEILRDKGTDRARFFRGQVDKYTWVDTGSSWVLSEILGSVLYSQLQDAETIQQRRKKIWNRYQQTFQTLEEAGLCRTPKIPSHCEIPWHLYYILLPDLSTRVRLMEYLKRHEIVALSHYIPLHTSPFGKYYVRKNQCLPVSERVSETLLRFPIFPDLTEIDQEEIIERTLEFFQVDRVEGGAEHEMGYLC